MTSRILIMAACFAFTAGCQARKQSTTDRAQQPPPPATEPRETTEAAGEDRENVAGQTEPLPPEPDLEVPDPADVTMDSPVELLGIEVAARVEKVDRKRNQVVFAIQDDISEIRLQSGKEIRVPFNDLRLLTGMERDQAIEALESAETLNVRVLGVGDAMRIVEIALPEGSGEPVREEE